MYNPLFSEWWSGGSLPWLDGRLCNQQFMTRFHPGVISQQWNTKHNCQLPILHVTHPGGELRLERPRNQWNECKIETPVLCMFYWFRGGLIYKTNPGGRGSTKILVIKNRKCESQNPVLNRMYSSCHWSTLGVSFRFDLSLVHTRNFIQIRLVIGPLHGFHTDSPCHWSTLRFSFRFALSLVHTMGFIQTRLVICPH